MQNQTFLGIEEEWSESSDEAWGGHGSPSTGHCDEKSRKENNITWRAAGKVTSSTKVLICWEQNMKEMLRKMDEDTGDFIIKALSYGKCMKGLQKLEA